MLNNSLSEKNKGVWKPTKKYSCKEGILKRENNYKLYEKAFVHSLYIQSFKALFSVIDQTSKSIKEFSS